MANAGLILAIIGIILSVIGIIACGICYAAAGELASDPDAMNELSRALDQLSSSAQ